MRTLSPLIASVSLFRAVASPLVLGGVIFALFLFVPLFLLAPLGVLAGFADRTVRQHNPPMNPRGWQDGS
jgi:hypothetical protein